MSYEATRDLESLDRWWRLSIAVIALVLGRRAAALLVDRLVSIRAVRKMISSDSWAEGYWLLNTYDSVDQSNPLTRTGILFLEYRPGDGELKAVTTRVNEKMEVFTVFSEFAITRDDAINIEYLNYFSLNYPGPGAKRGMVYSKFGKSNHFAGCVDTYEGCIAMEEEGVLRRQQGIRIPETLARALRKRHGGQWISKTLRNVSGDHPVTIDRIERFLKDEAGT